MNERAALWRKGLAEWGQDAGHIARLREIADLRIYTPGSSAGLPLAVLKGFAEPPREQGADKDTHRETISATAARVLALAGIDADPVTSREHVLLGNLLEYDCEYHRGRGEPLDLPALLGAIQQRRARHRRRLPAPRPRRSRHAAEQPGRRAGFPGRD